MDWTLTIAADAGALLVCSWCAWRSRRELERLRSRLRAVTPHDAQPERASSQAIVPAARRQLTLGECIAAAELANRFDTEALAEVPLTVVMKVVDAMRVCTTCGQLEHSHRPDAQWSRACTRYAPREP